ncbi:MAG: hypothetical protein Q7T55_16570 [Solirubrobacteraceae bacterium]|nr:hypothetical protein [Solirubrobacteraceae bacterium]
MTNAPPLCPQCHQPASLALAGHEHGWECRNEACPEFGQEIGIDSDHGVEQVREQDDAHPASPQGD